MYATTRRLQHTPLPRQRLNAVTCSPQSVLLCIPQQLAVCLDPYMWPSQAVLPINSSSGSTQQAGVPGSVSATCLLTNPLTTVLCAPRLRNL